MERLSPLDPTRASGTDIPAERATTVTASKVIALTALGVVVLILCVSGQLSVSTAKPLQALPPATLLPSDSPVVDATIRLLESRIKRDPEDFIAYNKLAGLYLQ